MSGLRIGRAEWIAHPAPISIWNNQPTAIEISLLGRNGSATCTIEPHALLTLGVPASLGEPTSLREGALGGSGCATGFNDGFGSLREGALLVVGAIPNGQGYGCGTVSGPVEGLEVIRPDAGPRPARPHRSRPPPAPPRLG